MTTSTMTTSKLALIAVLPLLLACGERGASEEMRDASGEANAPGTEIPEEEGRFTGFAEGDEEGQMAKSPDIISEETRSQFGREAGLTPVLADPRRGDAAARDEFRNPAETLGFLGMEPDMTVVEIWPGGGYYADIIAPALKSGGGVYYAIASEREGSAEGYRERFGDEERYGDVEVATLGTERGLDGVPDGSADMVLTFRNVHNWHMGGFADQAFEEFFAALKPGGVLGVVEHRLPEEADDEMEMSSGYMKQSNVIAMAEAAGFDLADQSEVNANPKDDADHPFGVWTLRPRSVTEDREGNVPDGFDADEYFEIGESDRMTLRFVKPLGADGALME